MVSIKTILSWFRTDLFPSEEQFKQAWTSFWHKSEKLPIEQTFGLKDALAEKANKSEVVIGTILMGEKENEAEIKALPTAKKGDTYKANDTGDYWTYTGENDEPYNPDKWANNGKILPSDAVTQEEFENLSEATQAAQNISIISNSEFIYAIVDANETLLWGKRWDGSTYDIGLPDNVSSLLDSVHNSLNNLDDDITQLDTELTPAKQISITQDTEFISAFVDSLGTIIAGFKRDNGKFHLPTQAMIDKSEDSEFLFSFPDSKGGVIWGIKKDLSVYQPIGISVEADTRLKTIEEIIFALKIARVIGDSLSQGEGYVAAISAELGANYITSANGVGGETSQTIGARMGAIPMYIDNPDFTINGNASVSGIILKSSYDDYEVAPLLQGSNPMRYYIQNEEYSLSVDRNSKIYTLTRISDSGSVEIKQGATLTPTPAYKESDLDIIGVGTNDKQSLTNEQMIEKIRMFVNAAPNKYIVVGIPRKNEVDLPSLEKAMLKAFGQNYINLREYLITNALRDAGITPTAQDIEDVNNGIPPTSLRKDDVHYTLQGNQLIAKYIIQKANQIYNL